ncbi:MAG: CRISPR system precrRNA processing endoribonuclease RAMP protein Cas6 [Planctomycetota bacterium]|nr:CRISPR system precrRNA processing endoribonuclease RAMP protein Cas6 [Planctomycetota bacterium]
MFSLFPGESRNGKFNLKLLTPTLIKVRGNISRSPSLKDISLSIVRKAILFRAFYGDGVDDDLAAHYRNIASTVVETARKYHPATVSRYSARQKREIPLRGVIGSIECEGDIGALEPLLRAGEYIGVGKNTAFGLGRIKLETA